MSSGFPLLEKSDEAPTAESNAAVSEFPNPAVEIGHYLSPAEEAEAIAYQFRYSHLIDGIPWNQMAVLLRAPGIQATAIRRAFAYAGIPVATNTESLSSNSALAPFILLAQVAIGDRHLNKEICENLLLSEFGGADAISVRRIRRSLIASRAEDDSRSGTELLIAAIDTGEVSVEGATRSLEFMTCLNVHEKLFVERARKLKICFGRYGITRLT
ncbi:MAG: hypothetical protein WDO06_00125 [Actinomycetota bacterium]